MKRLLLFTLTLAGIAGAQTTPQQFTGIHYTGSACPTYINVVGYYTTNGENNCSYVGNITTDPNAAYAYLTDNTGTVFPCTTTEPKCINPYMPPPSVNLSGPWTGSANWDSGGGFTGNVPIASGTCYVTGPIFYTSTLAVYTVQCSGVDVSSNPMSKMQKYSSTKSLGRYWQPLVMYNQYNNPSQWGNLAFYVPYPDPPAGSNVVGGVDDGPSDH